MTIAKHLINVHSEVSSEEWHIAGVVVHANPARLDEIRAAIDLMAGAEIHAASDAGKLVVTLEAPTSRAIAAHLEYLHRLEGVFSAALVYQHNEDAAAMTEEMSDDLHPPGFH